MTKTTHRLSLLGLAVAATLQLAACGGGSAGAPDVFPPTVAITDNVVGIADGPVTFTFTFNEDVGSTFTIDDFLVTGGTVGAFTRVSATQYTLLVTPPSSSTGGIVVTVKEKSFGDAAGNLNTVVPTVTQEFNTAGAPVPGVSGSTGTCTAAPCINFAEATLGMVDFGGLGIEVTADPMDATNKVGKLTKEAADEPWAGVTVHLGGADNTVARIDPALGISLRVYSPAAGETVMVKIENGANDTINQESLATTTKAGEWETLTFAYPNADAGATYNKVSVFPAFNTQVNKVFYIDELKYTEKSSTTPPPPATNLVTNGDFEAGNTGWTGNAANVVTEGGNSYNFATVAAAGNPYDVNLSYVLNIPTSGVGYKLRFKASSNRARTMLAGIGLNQDPWTNVTQAVNLTTTLQTFELSLTSNFASPTSRVIFDMGADTGDVVIDDVELVLDAATPPPAESGPTVAALAPTALASNVKSIFSDSYTNVTVNEWGPDWGPASARITDGVIAGNNYKTIDMSIAGKEFAGISFVGSKFNATAYSTFNIDYWVATPLPAGQVINIKLSNHDGSGETSAIQYLVNPVVGGSWQRLSIPLSSFTVAGGGSSSRNNIAEIIITAARANTADPVKVYFDNMYFSQ